MRFFGFVFQEWHEDAEREDNIERHLALLATAVADYERHLQALPSFPEELRRITQAFYVDDALFVRALYEPAKARLKLILRCGNIPDGYFDLILHYEGVEISPQDLDELARAARGAQTARRYEHDAYCHELDLLPDGSVEHSFLFHGSWNRIATDQWERVLPVMFTVRCKTLTWERIERPDRKLPRVRDRFRMV